MNCFLMVLKKGDLVIPYWSTLLINECLLQIIRKF